jgi:hypothetical protein
MAKKTTKPAAADNTAPSPARGEEVLAAWKQAGGVGDVAACVADLLAMVFVEGCVARGEAMAEGDGRFPGIDTPESVCEEAVSAVEVWIEDERRGAWRDDYPPAT